MFLYLTPGGWAGKSAICFSASSRMADTKSFLRRSGFSRPQAFKSCERPTGSRSSSLKSHISSYIRL